MNHRHAPTKLGVLLALGLAAVLPLQAGADNIAFQGKFKAGLTQGDLKAATQRNSMMGLGLEMTYALGSDAKLVTELTYQYFSSEAIPTIFPSATEAPAGPNYMTSADVRKNDLTGIGAKVGYRKTWTGDWSWQAGVTLDNFKSRQEVTGTLRTAAGTEGLAFTPEKSGMSVGFYGGLHQKISEACSVEYNVHYLGFSMANYRPRTYTGTAPTVESVKKNGLMLQVALGFSF